MKTFMKYLSSSILVLIVFTGQLHAGCRNIGNYVRGSSPVIGGYVTPHNTVEDVKSGTSTTNTTYLSGSTKKPWYNSDCAKYVPGWQKGSVANSCLYNGVVYSVDREVTPAGWLPRHFGNICYSSTWVWGAYRYYKNPRCPNNTAPIKSVGYVTNDGKNFGVAGKYFASKINLAPSGVTLFDTIYNSGLKSTNHCPANSKHMGSSKCKTIGPIEVTLCVATDTK